MVAVIGPSPLPWGDRLVVPIVAIDRCTACGRCVDVCPTGAITLTAGPRAALNLVIDGESCDYCTECETACPANAVECPFEVVG